MSEIDGRHRSRFSFTEFYFGMKVIGGIIGLGLAIIFCSEMLRPKDQEKPVWLTGLEYVYALSAVVVAKTVSWAFDTSKIERQHVRPECAISVYKTKLNESTKQFDLQPPKTRDVADLSNPQPGRNDWIVVTDQEENQNYWVSGSQYENLRRKSGCGQR